MKTIGRSRLVRNSYVAIGNNANSPVGLHWDIEHNATIDEILGEVTRHASQWEEIVS